MLRKHLRWLLPLAVVMAAAATASPALTAPAVGGCSMNSSYCVLQNQYGEQVGPLAGTNHWLISYNSSPDAYHLVLRPGGTWGEIKSLNYGSCWNLDASQSYHVAENGCNSSFTNGNELWRLIPSGGHWVIDSYAKTGFYLWTYNSQGFYCTLDGNVDGNTLLDANPLP